ncbi:MAG: flagellar biosynthesis protein FliQ [Lachnospiraceae bacterium]|nr:flagellar biosynthesis protein FliQ [Lachnospiraceae bacterium]
MSTSDVVDIASQAIWLIIKCAAPMLLVSLIVGLIISIFQTVTSIQEQTLTFVPKILAVFITIIICGDWILTSILQFIQELFGKFGDFVR